MPSTSPIVSRTIELPRSVNLYELYAIVARVIRVRRTEPCGRRFVLKGDSPIDFDSCFFGQGSSNLNEMVAVQPVDGMHFHVRVPVTSVRVSHYGWPGTGVKKQRPNERQQRAAVDAMADALLAALA